MVSLSADNVTMKGLNSLFCSINPCSGDNKEGIHKLRVTCPAQGAVDSRMVLLTQCYSKTVFLSEPFWSSHRPGGFTATEKNVGLESMQ